MVKILERLLKGGERVKLVIPRAIGWNAKADILRRKKFLGYTKWAYSGIA